MSKLTKLLEFAYAGNAKRHKMLNSSSFKRTVLDTIPDKKTKELLLASEVEETTLLQEEVYKTVVEGAEPFKCAREIIPVIHTDTYSVRFVYGEAGSYADVVPEGGKITIETQDYNKKDITINKIGTRPLITNEMIEDSLFDVVELELKKAGARLENKLNRDVITTMISDANGTTPADVDPAGTHIAVSDIATAIGEVKSIGFLPTKLVTHPTAEGYLLQDSNLAYVSYAGTNTPLTEGKVPKLLGLEPYTLGVTTVDPTYHWDATDAAHHYYAMVVDPANYAVIAMRRDITVEKYNDPIHDLVGISATMRYGTGVIQDQAAVRILAK